MYIFHPKYNFITTVKDDIKYLKQIKKRNGTNVSINIKENRVFRILLKMIPVLNKISL